MKRSTLTFAGLVVVIAAALAGGPGQAAKTGLPPSASPSGGERLPAGGNADLTRERLAAFIRDYPGPERTELGTSEGEEHDDDERAAPRVAGAPYTSLDVSALALESPQPLASWKAMDQSGGHAGDATIAVSTTHVVVTNRKMLQIFDKSGSDKGKLTGSDLFSPLGLSSNSFKPFPIDTYFDMRALFDPHRKRFWVMGLGVNSNWRNRAPADIRHVTSVAVSKTENPLDGWYLYWWDSVPHWGVANDAVYKAGDASDYPTIGIDTGLFHETHAVNNYATSPKTFKFWRVTFFGADQMAAGLPFANVPGWQFWDLQNPDGTVPDTIQAVVHHTASPYSFYVSRIPDNKVTPGHVLIVWALAKAFQPGQVMVATKVSLPDGWLTPTDAPQLTDPNVLSDQLIRMTNLGTKPIKAVYRNNLLYFVTNDAMGPFTAVRYVRLLVNTYPLIILDDAHKFISRTFGVTDAIESGDLRWSGWPGVEVNKSGDAAIVFASVSPSIHPGVRYSTYHANETDVRLSRLLKEGEAVYHSGDKNIDDSGNLISMPWGDTAGASVDPKDDTGIWIAQQYSTTSSSAMNYAIWVGKVFGAVYFDLLFQNVRVESADFSNRQLTVSGQVHNGGDGASPDAQVSFYLLAGRGSPVLLGTLPQASLKPGENGDFRTTLQLSRSISAGEYELRAVVETSSRKSEYSDANNATVVPFVLQ